MRIDRLNQLITVLKGVDPDTFDLGTWCCGTAACAVGHACLSQVFIDQGLHLNFSRPCFTVDGDKLMSWTAVEVFFELTVDQAFNLFSDEAYGGHEDTDDYVPSGATADDVIQRIQEFIGSQS